MLKQVLVGVAMLLIVAQQLPAAPAAATQPALSGRVLDPSGKPIASATVELYGPAHATVTSDAQGNYSASVSRAGEYRIGARADGFVTIEYYRNPDGGIQLAPDSAAKKDIIMQPGARLRVKVVDLIGVPLNNVSVDVARSADDRYNRSLRRQQTDASGRTEFTIAPAPDPYVVFASMEGHEPVQARVTASALDKPYEAELALLPGTPIKGVAICNDGKPAAGWSIVAYPEWWGSNYIPRGAKIDDAGNFTLTDVGPGKYNLHVSMSNSLRQVTSMTFPPSSQPIRIDLPMPSPAQRVKFAGRVRIIGSPRPDYVMVQAQGLGGEQSWDSTQVNFSTPRPRRAATGAATRPAAANAQAVEGTFTFDSIPVGDYRISFSSPTVEHKVLEKVTIPGELSVVELKAFARSRLAGTVTDAANGKPIARFRIRIEKVQSIGNAPNYVQEGNWIQVDRPDGKFETELVGPGVYKVQAAAEGYAWLWSEDVRVEGGATGRANIRLSKGGSLAGIVVDAAGKPVTGAKVIPNSKARTVAMRGEGRFEGEAGAALTDGRGIFKINFLAPGDESVKVVHDHFAPAFADGFKITDGSTTDAGTIAVKSGGTVEGVVYDEKGKPAPAVTLLFQDQTGYGGGGDELAGRLATVTTNEQGKYRVEHLPEQPIYVIVQDAWQRGGMIRRTVRPQEGKTARLDFGGPAPNVSGRLLADGKPDAHTRVHLTTKNNPHFGPVMAAARTDEQGRFSFMGMPPGRYVLYSEDKGGRGGWLNVRDVEVTSETLDLGDIAPDVGEVVATITADNPEDLKSVRHVSVNIEASGRLYQQHVTSLTDQTPAAGASVWRGRNVPAGKFRLAASSAGESSITVETSFERKAGEKETAVKLHIPKRTGELTVRIGGADRNNRVGYAMLQNEDRTVRAGVSAEPNQPRTIKLPPGKYQVMEGSSSRPHPGVAPVEVKEGTPASVEVDLSMARDKNAPRVVAVAVWDSTGVLAPGLNVTLTDAAGNAAISAGEGGVGPAFMVTAGKYQARVERTGGEPLVQEVEVPPPPATPMRMRGGEIVHIVLP